MPERTSTAARDLAAFVRLLRPAQTGVSAAYDRVAKQYDGFAALWDRSAGAPAAAQFRRLVHRHVREGALVLGAGTGTGRTVRLLLEETEPGWVVGTDLSAGMPAQARARMTDPRVVLVRGDVTALPYPNETFDVVTSMWMLETLPDPMAAALECLRVLRPDGMVLTAFSILPVERAHNVAARLIELLMRPGFAGRFLPQGKRPLHTCTMTCAHGYDYGLATGATFGKRCQLSAVALPRNRAVGRS